MWSGSWLTKLSAVLEPRDMSRDFVIGIDSTRPRRQRLYSRDGAGLRALATGCQFWCFVLPVVVLWGYGAIASEEGRRQLLVRDLLPVLVVSQFVAVGAYAILPKTQVFTRSGDDYFSSHPVTADLNRIVAEAVAAGASFGEVRTRVGDHLAAKRTPNRLLGGQMREEDSPGNYTLRQSPDGIELRIYDHSGYETRTRYPRDPADPSD